MMRLAILSICVGSASCASLKVPVKIHDTEWCGDKVEEGATCFHTLSKQKRVLSKDEWNAIRFGRISGEARAFAEVIAQVEKLCEAYSCTYEETQKVEQSKKNLRRLMRSMNLDLDIMLNEIKAEM